MEIRVSPLQGSVEGNIPVNSFFSHRIENSDIYRKDLDSSGSVRKQVRNRRDCTPLSRTTIVGEHYNPHLKIRKGAEKFAVFDRKRGKNVASINFPGYKRWSLSIRMFIPAWDCANAESRSLTSFSKHMVKRKEMRVFLIWEGFALSPLSSSIISFESLTYYSNANSWRKSPRLFRAESESVGDWRFCMVSMAVWMAQIGYYGMARKFFFVVDLEDWVIPEFGVK